MSSSVRGLAVILCLAACARPAPSVPSLDDGYGKPPPPQGPAPAQSIAAPSATLVSPTVPAAMKEPPSTRPTAPHAQGHQPTVKPFQRGKATYYADSLAGNPTASGEPYDPGQLTAAHRTLPFGSVVDVVRRDGRWVRVTITDRGPFAKGRIIDLSRRAAEAIGMIEAGVVDVTLYVVRRGD